MAYFENVPITHAVDKALILIQFVFIVNTPLNHILVTNKDMIFIDKLNVDFN